MPTVISSGSASGVPRRGGNLVMNSPRPSNQALKLTRRAGCLLGGPGFGEDRAVRRTCPLPAVQLSAGVRPPNSRYG